MTTAITTNDANLLSNSRKEAKRLLKISKTSGISINNLSDSQALISQLKGKTNWHELVKNSTENSTEKSTEDVTFNFIRSKNIAHIKGGMQLGYNFKYKGTIQNKVRNYISLSPEKAVGTTLVFGDPDRTKDLLLSMATEAIRDGLGLIYITADGKSNDYSFLRGIAKSCNRDHEVFNINFFTFNWDDAKGIRERNISNRWNPFKTMNQESIVKLLLSDISPIDLESFWVKASILLIEVVLGILVEIRDVHHVGFNANDIRRCLSLETLMAYLKSDKIVVSKVLLNEYLSRLPGYKDSKQFSDQPDIACEQHGYLQMQFTKMLGNFSDTYGYIFTDDVSDFTMQDVINSGKILIVNLPALQKTPDEIAVLGRFVLSAIQAALEEINEVNPITRMIFSDIGLYNINDSHKMFNNSDNNVQFVLSSNNYRAFSFLYANEAALTFKHCAHYILLKMDHVYDASDIITRSSSLNEFSNVNLLLSYVHEELKSNGAYIFRKSEALAIDAKYLDSITHK